MVRETKSIGNRQTSDGAVQEDTFTLRNIAVYDSHRNIEDWELAFISEQLHAADKVDPSKRVTSELYDQIQTIIGKETMMDIFHRQIDHDLKINKKFFKAFIQLKSLKKFELMEVGFVAKMLRSTGHSEIAEKVEP